MFEKTSSFSRVLKEKLRGAAGLGFIPDFDFDSCDPFSWAQKEIESIDEQLFDFEKKNKQFSDLFFSPESGLSFKSLKLNLTNSGPILGRALELLVEDGHIPNFNNSLINPDLVTELAERLEKKTSVDAVATNEFEPIEYLKIINFVFETLAEKQIEIKDIFEEISGISEDIEALINSWDEILKKQVFLDGLSLNDRMKESSDKLFAASLELQQVSQQANKSDWLVFIKSSQNFIAQSINFLIDGTDGEDNVSLYALSNKVEELKVKIQLSFELVEEFKEIKENLLNFKNKIDDDFFTDASIAFDLTGLSKEVFEVRESLGDETEFKESKEYLKKLLLFLIMLEFLKTDGNKIYFPEREEIASDIDFTIDGDSILVSATNVLLKVGQVILIGGVLVRIIDLIEDGDFLRISLDDILAIPAGILNIEKVFKLLDPRANFDLLMGLIDGVVSSFENLNFFKNVTNGFLKIGSGFNNLLSFLYKTKIGLLNLDLGFSGLLNFNLGFRNIFSNSLNSDFVTNLMGRFLSSREFLTMGRAIKDKLRILKQNDPQHFFNLLKGNLSNKKEQLGGCSLSVIAPFENLINRSSSFIEGSSPQNRDIISKDKIHSYIKRQTGLLNKRKKQLIKARSSSYNKIRK